MKALLDPADREFLERIHRMGGGTVQEICGELSVTATAVRQRLGRLQHHGLVTRVKEQHGRGRPRHIYSVSAAGQRELGDNYADLAMILWREIRGIDVPEIREWMMERIRRALVERYGGSVRSETLNGRIEELSRSLSAHGFDVEADSAANGLPILRENACPYFELASADPDICELEQDVFREILGADVELTSCCLDGHHCCEFHAAERSEAELTTANRVD